MTESISLSHRCAIHIHDGSQIVVCVVCVVVGGHTCRQTVSLWHKVDAIEREDVKGKWTAIPCEVAIRSDLGTNGM